MVLHGFPHYLQLLQYLTEFRKICLQIYFLRFQSFFITIPSSSVCRFLKERRRAWLATTYSSMNIRNCLILTFALNHLCCKFCLNCKFNSAYQLTPVVFQDTSFCFITSYVGGTKNIQTKDNIKIESIIT